MPTYEYVCDGCNHAFELFQQMSAPVKKKCPDCGTLKLRRLIGTGAGVLFKGSGFYQTDYRSDSYKKAAKAEKSSGETKDKKSGGDKPAAKPSDSTSSSSSTKASKPGKSTD